MVEAEGYREQLKDITEFFTTDIGVKRILSATDVGRYLNINYKTAQTRYGITKSGITIIELARKLTRTA